MEYRKPMPEFLLLAARTPALQRLQGVGMHCGCQYTNFPRFRGLAPYSRFDHSLGVARILWDATGDPVQTLAGLLHDAATPVFSHVVDFLNGDHLRQESTEAGLEEIIKKDTALLAVLEQYKIDPQAVSDCSRYPLADCPSPGLCADRLEYTLSNAIHYGAIRDVQPLYDDLVVAENGQGAQELQFLTPTRALAFAQAALECGRVYVCDEDRYAMERLSRLLRLALERGILTGEDLYTDEDAVIEKLLTSELKDRWLAFRGLTQVFRAEAPGEHAYAVPAKKRYIDPLVRGLGRVTELFPEFKTQVEEFIHQRQDYLLAAR